jgi:crotonobetainyl-CoA:carnitine CoA-transferase CaiB-like acyl-CoA transferase
MSARPSAVTAESATALGPPVGVTLAEVCPVLVRPSAARVMCESGAQVINVELFTATLSAG